MAPLNQIKSALMLLTRIPFIKIKDENFDIKSSIWAFPLVGLVLALILGLVSEILLYLNVPDIISATLLALLMSLLIGGFHEDGLADCFDGLGAYNKERRLEIMRDSMIGSYGTLALIFNIILRILLIEQLIHYDLVWIGLLGSLMFSRYAILWVIQLSDPARQDGIAQGLKEPIQSQLKKASLFVAIIGFLVSDLAVIGLFIISIGAAFLIAHYATKKIDGFTGDVLGATEQISQLMLFGLILAWF